MRSFLGKIFVCMLLVPLLARSGGIILESTLGDLHPQSERTLSMVMPAMAALAAAELDRNGQGALDKALEASHGLVRLIPASARCTNAPGPAVVTPIPNAPSLCLSAMPPPRPLVLGVIPASLWFLLPALELLFSAVVSFFLARYLAGPILRTRAAAAAFAAGDLNARTAPGRASRRSDEAADLEREFNRMADGVAAMIAAQRRFIADVSHEIRSPLGRLAVALGLARREAGSAFAPRFDRMEREMESVSRLVRELLVLASLQGSVGPAQTEVVDLSEVLDRVIDDMTFEFHDRASTIHTIRKAGAVLVRGDPSMLRRAVENVLRNALFYTPDGTNVEAIVDRDGGWARLVIRDYGPGVPEAALGQLFNAFFRVDEARARNTGGTGLGLAISRRAVELHGGRIRASNARPHGLAVRIEVPLAEASALQAAPLVPA